MKGLGLKEEIVIKDLEEYSKDCSDNLEECKIPLNEFVFDSPKNAKLGAELFSHYLDGENPIEYYLKSRGFLKNKIYNLI